MEMGVNAWHQTQESVWQGWWKVNGTAPLTKAWGEWIEDLKGMVSEPVSPLRTIVSHHWTNILEAINNNNLSIDKNILNQLSEMKHALDGTVAKSKGEIANHLKRGRSIEERISTHLTELKDSFDEFISKSSGIDAEQFLRGFEQEMKQKWLELSLDAMFFE